MSEDSAEIEGRVCTKCSLFKPKDCFGKCKKTKSGMMSQCKACKNKYEEVGNRSRYSSGIF